MKAGGGGAGVVRFMNPMEGQDAGPEPEPEPPPIVDKRDEAPSDPAEKLDWIFQIALEAEHPAIDEGGITTMRSYIESGRFSPEHYTNMWTKRLEGMNILV